MYKLKRNRSNRLDKSALQIGMALAVLSLACTPSTRGQGSVTGPQIVDAIVIVDLSASLTYVARQRTPDIVRDYLDQLPANSRFEVRLLENVMDGVKPIAAGQLKSKYLGKERVEDLDRVRDETRRKIVELLKNPNKYTSCYLKSLEVFVPGYFRNRQGDSRVRRMVIWIGDMVEDCDDPEFKKWKIDGNTVRRVSGEASNHQPQWMDKRIELSDIEVYGVSVPRDPGQMPPSAPLSMVEPFWRTITGPKSLHVRGFWIGTPFPSAIGPVAPRGN